MDRRVFSQCRPGGGSPGALSRKPGKVAWGTIRAQNQRVAMRARAERAARAEPANMGGSTVRARSNTTREPASATRSEPELGTDALRALLRHMLRVRCVDERMLKLQRAGRVGFVGTARGLEAAIVGSAFAL